MTLFRTDSQKKKRLEPLKPKDLKHFPVDSNLFDLNLISPTITFLRAGKIDVKLLGPIEPFIDTMMCCAMISGAYIRSKITLSKGTGFVYILFIVVTMVLIL
ncbi:hypothetical protein ACIQZG_01490 [Lysinibacillus sp. NPDC096418]|uniref:hypothetical protein n=1 Tax=Lysinibacillus sp. NPDC096418 TaxID=3364138 RepID=UPI0038084414